MNRDQRLDLFARSMKYDLIGLTDARIAIGTASLAERLGHRWPRLFPKFAAENARRDAKSREMNAHIQASIAEVEAAWRRLRDSVT